MGKTSSMEEPSKDDENSACIGAEESPEVTSSVHTDTENSPEARKVYGNRWS